MIYMFLFLQNLKADRYINQYGILKTIVNFEPNIPTCMVI